MIDRLAYRDRFLLWLGGAVALVRIGYAMARPIYAVASTRDAYLIAATDCFEGRSALADLEGHGLSDEDYRLAYRAALVPAMACLEKARIEAWLASLGVSNTGIASLSLEALGSAQASLGHVARELGVR